MNSDDTVPCRCWYHFGDVDDGFRVIDRLLCPDCRAGKHIAKEAVPEVKDAKVYGRTGT